MLGLVGAHRVGKTTLAKEYSAASGVPFVETSVSAICKRLGFDPASEVSFGERLELQREILSEVDKVYAPYAGQNFVADRTPMDMIAYTMAEATGHRVGPEEQEAFAQYVRDCYEVTNRRFGILVVVQPGIDLVQEEGKAAINQAYIEHLNTLMIGLCIDPRCNADHYVMPREMLLLEDRLGALSRSVRRSYERAVEQRNRHHEHGGLFM